MFKSLLRLLVPENILGEEGLSVTGVRGTVKFPSKSKTTIMSKSAINKLKKFEC